MRSVLLRRSYETRVLVVYIVSLAMIVIDGTMVNVALPAMADDFGVLPNEAEWVAVGYLLAVAVVTPASGWLGDRFGTRRVFVMALATFTVVSGFCGLARTLDQLVVLRVLQGIGGGLVMPVGTAMLFRAFPLDRRAKASAAVLGVAVVAPALGPLLGGVLVDRASWHWIFLINLPVGVVALAAASSALEEETHPAPGRLDLLGLVLSGGSVGVLLYTLTIGPERGWGSPIVLGLAVLGAAGVVAAIVTELRVDEPALKLRLFGDRLFRTINLASPLLYAGFFGQLFILPIYLQSLRGHSAFTSGLVQSPQPLGILVVTNLVGQRAYRAIGPRRLMTFGGVYVFVVSISFALFDLGTPLWVVALVSFARGLGMGLVFISIQTAVYATTSHADTGRATALFITQRQFSYATGVAIAATVITAGLRGVPDDAPPVDQLAAHQWAFFVLGAITLPGALLSWRIRDEDVAGTRGLAVVDAH